MIGDRTVFWKVLDGVAVQQAWLKSRGLDAELSGAGRICMQMIRRLGGPLGTHVIANADVLRFLDGMAHGTVDTDDDEKLAKGRKPKARGRTVARDRLWSLLLKVHQNHELSAERDFNRLTELGVLRCGLELQCPSCAQSNWFSLEQLAEELTCDRCLQPFPFPAARPPDKAWTYRTQGSFSIENYAQGAYAVAITLRFFLAMLQTEATWAPSLKLKDQHGEFEIDFAMWCQARHRDTFEPTLVIGECKSFNERFEPRDLRRARDLAKRFPGTLLVFATLREKLEPTEKRRIAGLARAGRRRTKADKWRTPVMVLTAHELMGRMGPPFCWKDAGGKMAQFAEHYRGHDDLLELCDATQQLHLGMESDAAFRTQYFAQIEERRRRARGGRSTSAGSRPTHSCQPGAILASLSRSLSRPEAARGRAGGIPWSRGPRASLSGGAGRRGSIGDLKRG